MSHSIMAERLDDIINEQLKIALKAAGKTQSWLADQLNVEKGYVSELLNAKKRWNTEQLNKALKALEIRPTDFITKQAHRDQWMQRQIARLAELKNEDRETFEHLLSRLSGESDS